MLKVTKMLLLLIQSHLLLCKLRVVQVKLLELLSSGLNLAQLLLESLLLLGQIHVGCNKLSIQVGIHLLLSLVINGEFRRGKNLVHSVLLVLLLNLLLHLLLRRLRLRGSLLLRLRLRLLLLLFHHGLVPVGLLSLRVELRESRLGGVGAIDMSCETVSSKLLGWPCTGWRKRGERCRSRRLWGSPQTCKQV